MIVARRDADVICRMEVMKMQDEYQKKFGELFIAFNYVDFPGTEEKCPGQQYVETLEAALKSDKPYHIVSRRHNYMSY